MEPLHITFKQVLELYNLFCITYITFVFLSFYLFKFYLPPLQMRELLLLGTAGMLSH